MHWELQRRTLHSSPSTAKDRRHGRSLKKAGWVLVGPSLWTVGTIPRAQADLNFIEMPSLSLFTPVACVLDPTQRRTLNRNQSESRMSTELAHVLLGAVLVLVLILIVVIDGYSHNIHRSQNMCQFQSK